MAVSTQTPSFIFSADGKAAPTYDQLRKRRQVLDAMLAQQGQRAPQNIGEGIFALGQGIATGLEGRALRKAEEAGAATSQKAWGDLAALGPGGSSGAGSFGAGAGYSSATGRISDASPTPSGTIDAASALPASFLAAVDREEGGGDYDTLFGHSQKNGPFAGVGVSGLTIGQALDFASPSGAYGQYVKGKVGRVATPMGRHQIVGTTLRNAATEMGLDPSTPFNQQTQDSIAAHLARKRIAGADTMAGKIRELRGEWEGFRNVPDAELATIVMDLQNGSGSPPPQSAEPVQVASLDPSEGVAQAIQKGASVSTTTQVGANRPQPANVPVPTAREALEKAFAAQAEQDGMSGIAPAGMPGSTPQTEAAIQQYAAANGTTPLQYQDGTRPAELGAEDVAALQARPRDPQAVPYAGPGATIDPRDVPQLQGGAREQPRQIDPAAYNANIDAITGAPVPTPRPEMAQQGGVPPQAVAASAMAQQPAPFDPVNGTAMGGNTGAADAAKAAYLERRDPEAHKRLIAQALVANGARAAPASNASPEVQRVAQAYGQRQAQDQAQGRFQQLMGIAINPAVDPGARQYAMQMLEQDQQFRNQQQNRAYEAWKTQQEWGREDRRDAITNQREDARLRLDQEKAAREGRAPINVGGTLVDPQTYQPVYQAPQQPFTLQPGETRFDGAGNQIAAGGAKPGYRNLTPAEVSQLGLAPGAYQAGPDGKIEAVGKGGISIFTGENGSEFVKEGEKSANTRLGEIITAGQSAQGMLGDVQQLADLGRQIGTGKIAQVKAALGPYAQALGIDIANQGEAEAYQSIIARMAPQMRPAGSGATSDFDAQQFLAALPSLGNSPEGNQIITDTFERVSQNKMQAAEIASLAYLPKEQGGIPWQEAEKRVRNLPNPYQQFREMQRQQSRQGVADAPAQMQAPAPMPAQVPAQALPQQQAPAQPARARQRYDRGAPVRQPVAPPPGEYRWNPATNRMEAM